MNASFNEVKVYQVAGMNQKFRTEGAFSGRSDNIPLQLITSKFTHEDTLADLENLGFYAYSIEDLREWAGQ